MSVAAFMLPSYGSMDPYSSHYQSSYQTGGAYVGGEPHGVPHSSPPATTFAPSYTASPTLMNTSPRVNQQATESRPQRGSSYANSYHSAGASPYLTPQSPPPPAYGMSNSASHVAQFSSQSPNVVHSHDMAPATYAPAYPIQPSAYSSAPYEPGYHSIAGTPPGYGAVQPASSYMGGQSYGIPNSTETAAANGEDSGVRILNARPKPQCWDHGCNGRQFSTFSNLLRHQREKSGTAAKSVCPRCGAEFTRTTARNGHMAHDKCKRKSTTSPSGTD